MKFAALLAAAATAVMLAGAAEPCLAQDASTPPPPPVPAGGDFDRPERPPRDGGDREKEKEKDWHRPSGRSSGGPGGSGYSGGFSRDRERGDMFKSLPEPERQKVRDAFEKAWQDPEVIAARDRMSKASEDMRNAIHHALKKADPEVVKILERIRPPGGFPGMARMPDPGDPEFAPQAIDRLSGELQAAARFERHEIDTKPMHERIIQAPPVKEAIQRVKDAPVEQRPEAWRRLREAYSGAARAEFVQAWGKSPWDKDRDRDRDRERGPGGFGQGSGFGGDNRERDRSERPPPPLPPAGDDKSGAPREGSPRAQ